jgi:NADH-quinone oxidoreductase subunit L
MFVWFAAIPLLPLLAAIFCCLLIARRNKTKLPAVLVVGSLALSFAVTVLGFWAWIDQGKDPINPQIYEWIGVSWGSEPGQSLTAQFGFYMDGLSWLWMLFVTGLATLIALYASEYMGHDVGKGYGRFFAAFALFVFSMACLVMGDNLFLLYLGWEGVGLCSYLLIGYFFQKPSAVAAAKKAFIVNRIGDLGLAVGIFLIFVTFGTVEYGPLFEMVRLGVDAAGRPLDGRWQEWVIPCLLMIGAFGKSAQFPLYVWLPDAMEGPTPVSALIHAATMVTAGVYLIARTMPLFLLDDTHFALTIVAWTGTITALLAATIGMAQFDIKRIMAYSTVSQLGYMFAGLGVLTSTGACFHVFTHAFFKALLFLACGAVMHGFAGQLDLRKLSGVQGMPGWRIVGLTMLVGCLNLAGFPLITSGYFSKDMILAQAFTTPGDTIWGSQWIGWVLLLTAGLTAYYTFRVYFRVFVGPQHFEPGDELHAEEDSHHGEHGEDQAEVHGVGKSHEHFHPHPPGWAINAVLIILALCSFLAIPTYFVMPEHHGWAGSMVHSSTAIVESPGAHHVEGADAEHLGTFLGYDPHKAMYYVSGIVGFLGIAVAFFLHLAGRASAATSRADALLPMLGPIPRWGQNKWYVDEFYEAVIRLPLWVLATLFHWFDQLVIDGLVNLFGLLPRLFARAIRPSQSGVLQGYAVGMAGGLAVVLIIVLIIMGRGG